MAVVFKGSDFPVCLCVVLEAEKWTLTDQDLKGNNSALWSDPYPRNPKSYGQGSTYNIICRTVPSSEDLITQQTHGLHDWHKVTVTL